jgi:hypothetical protein
VIGSAPAHEISWIPCPHVLTNLPLTGISSTAYDESEASDDDGAISL